MLSSPDVRSATVGLSLMYLAGVISMPAVSSGSSRKVSSAPMHLGICPSR